VAEGIQQDVNMKLVMNPFSDFTKSLWSSGSVVRDNEVDNKIHLFLTQNGLPAARSEIIAFPSKCVPMASDRSLVDPHELPNDNPWYGGMVDLAKNAACVMALLAEGCAGHKPGVCIKSLQYGLLDNAIKIMDNDWFVHFGK
jgi:hypothetical protein